MAWTAETVVALVGFGLVVVNLVTIVQYWDDKQRAIAEEKRIPESNLLFLAAIGGSPAALLARRWFRHKTRKEPFSTRLMVIVMVQAGVAIGLGVALID